TPGNTVLLPVKTTANGSFRVEAHDAAHGGALIWTLSTDYVPPGTSWFPICGVTITADASHVVVPAAGGTILSRTSHDSASGTATRLAFYGIANYNADPNAWAAAIKICTPISSDASGNLYFGYISTGVALPGYPAGLPSGLARISNMGVGSFVS